MKLLTTHLPRAKVEAGSQTSEGPGPRLLVLLLVVDELFQLGGKKAADAGAPLCGQRPRALQELAVNGDSDVLLHSRVPLVNYTRKIREGSKGRRGRRSD